MLKPFDLFEGVLNEIEKGLKEDINEYVLADKYFLSSVHLRRLFKFAFGRTIGAYIRSRKLAASMENLLLTDRNVLDIALEYGLEYEQSYIRAFKREFGLTPGELRKTGQIIKITPPLQLFNSNRLEDGLLFGPDIVFIPQFHVAGRKCKSLFRDALVTDPRNRIKFLDERMTIPDAINPNVFVNINSQAGADADYSWFMPAIQVKTLDNIPKEFDRYTFSASLCANFRFIGPNFSETNMAIADGMFRAIDDFMEDEHQKYFLERKRINIDRFDISAYDGLFCQWEWFAPVVEKTKDHIPTNPDGIFKTYKQKIPALRFIGKKYSEPPTSSLFSKILDSMDNWRLDYMFEAIEKKSGKEPKMIYEGGDAYISLIRKKDGGSFEYWLGMFMPEGTEVPDGYEATDFPESTLGVCSVYGKRNAITHYDAECRKKLVEEGFFIKKEEAESKWFFQRFNWREFFEEDRYGKRILEYCYFI